MITKITDKLYQGDYQDAKNSADVKCMCHKFDYIVTVAESSPFHGDVIFRLLDGDRGKDNKLLSQYEAMKQKELFKRCIEFIGSLDAGPVKILVHCNAGMSRSPAIAIGFLMAYHDYSYDKAWEHIKRQNHSIRIHPFFENILKNDEMFKRRSSRGWQYVYMDI